MADARNTDVEREHTADIVLRQLDTLPTLVPIAVRLLAAATDSKSSAADLVTLIQRDQSLTEKLLSAANSAAAGVAGGVKTLDQAVVLLGFSAVRGIVLTLKIFECFDGGRRGRGDAAFCRDEFWKHSLTVACVARELARLAGDSRVDPEEAYVAGLLHDLGKVALSAIFPKAYDRVAAQADHSRGDIGDFERAILGVDHTVVGRRLAEKWNLPKSLVEVIWLHHLATEVLPSSVTEAQLITLVHLADVIAREQRIGYSGNHEFYEPSVQIAARLGIDQDELDELVQSLFSRISQQAAMMGLGGASALGLYYQALTDANSELGRVHGELLSTNQRMSAASRYFAAIGEFSAGLDASSDFSQIVAAVAQAGAAALQRSGAVAFGLREDQITLDVFEFDDSVGCLPGTTMDAPAELLAWMGELADREEPGIIAAPAPVRALLAATGAGRSYSRPWVLPISRRGSTIGGIVIAVGPTAPTDRPLQNGERAELSSFTSNIALAMETANARAAARRLAEDLAETNRRLQQAQMQLLRSRTLSMIAEMASGAGHELNSPLTVISGRAQMLKQLTQDPEVARSLDLINDKAHECSRIVSELMDFAQPRGPKLETLDLGAIFAELRAEFLAQPDLPRSNFVIEMPQPPVQVLADRVQIRTVLHELIRNSQDALRQRPGILSIGCRPRISDDYVEIIVRDTGIGMPVQVLQRAFDPFYSHHTAGRRRGLGLARAHRIVESHGGRIWLESKPDEGTVAHVLLRMAGHSEVAK